MPGMRLQCLGNRVRDRLHPVRAEADCARAADSLEMLDQKLDLMPVVAITEEQRAYSPERLRHGEYIRAGLADVEEDFTRRAVHVVDRDVRHTERRIDFVRGAPKNLRPLPVLLVDDRAGTDAVIAGSMIPPIRGCR